MERNSVGGVVDKMYVYSDAGVVLPPLFVPVNLPKLKKQQVVCSPRSERCRLIRL